MKKLLNALGFPGFMAGVVLAIAIGFAAPSALKAAGFNPVTITDPGGVNQAAVNGSGQLSVTGTFSSTWPLTGANGTGTVGGAGQAAVADCNFTTAPATMTSGNVGPEQCTANGYQIESLLQWGTATLGNASAIGTPATGNIISVQGNASGVPIPVTGSFSATWPLTGANGTGTAGAAAQAAVASCNFTTAPATITSGNVGPIQCTNNGYPITENLLWGTAILGNATAIGVTASGNVIGVQGTTGGIPMPISGTVTATPPLTGANSTGTVGAAGQATVADCNFTTAPASFTSGNVGPISCTANGYPIVSVFNWGTAALGAATAAGTGAAGNIISVQGNASGVPLPTSCTAANCSVNVANVAGSAMTTSVGFAAQRLYPANTSGGGCDGVNLTTGTQITKHNNSTGLGASTATTQIVALASSQLIHICHLDVAGQLTANGLLSIIYGTGVNCGTGTTTVWATYITTANAPFILGDGESSVIEIPSGNALCYSTGAWTATAGPQMNLTYAQY